MQPTTRVAVPTLVLGFFAAWCTYDGWISPAPDIEWRTFNRYAAVFFALLAVAWGGVWALVARAYVRGSSSRFLEIFKSPDEQVAYATAPWFWSLTSSGVNLILHGVWLPPVAVYLVSLLAAVLLPSQPALVVKSIGDIALAAGATPLLRRRYAKRGWVHV